MTNLADKQYFQKKVVCIIMTKDPNTASIDNVAVTFSKLQELLQKEQNYDLESYQQSLAGRCMYGHLHESDCVYPIRLGGTSYTALDQLSLLVSFDVPNEDTAGDFEPGKPITFFRLGSDNQSVVPIPYQCYVDRLLGDGRLTVQLPHMGAFQALQALEQTHLLGLQIGIDNTTYRVMLEGLQQAAKSTQPAFSQLRSVVLGSSPHFRQLPKVTFPWLNDNQTQAVNNVLAAQEVSIVHGPPGTGKTTTLIEAIVETLRRETQVMVCAPSNAAVDWISTLLVRRGVSVLRVGNPLRMTDEMLECSYDRRYAAHPNYPELWSVRRALHELRDKGNGENIHENREKLINKRNILEQRIQNDLFENTRVVACTLIGSAYHILDGHHFSTLFIDEAAQALEPACWTAMLKADRLVLSGDHQQLPPTIKCVEAARGGLETTLMEKIAHRHPQCVSLLTMQYRMHTDIMQFSSQWFYHGQLTAAPEVANRLVSPIDMPLLFVDTSQCNFQEQQNARSLSRSNAEEARLLIHTLRDYIDLMSVQCIQNELVDFGIITPYRSQVRLLRRLLKMQHFFRSLRKQIAVDTVDGFQGQERDVIIISMVRDNEQGQIGFLRDLRRMNVAMTRARMKLIIIGNADVLSHHTFYRHLIEYFREKGSFTTVRPSETES
jgi:superfamily I DNA and/or RNA helicase